MNNNNTNYNRNTEFCLNVEQKLKNKLKEILQMQRSPKDISTFWAFYHLWSYLKEYAKFQELSVEEKREYKKLNSVKWLIVEDEFNKSNDEFNILYQQQQPEQALLYSVTLRTLCQHIPLELPLFINTTSLRKDLNTNPSVIINYSEYFVKSYYDNVANNLTGECKRILSFTDKFLELMEWCDGEFGKLGYPEEFASKYFNHQLIEMNDRGLSIFKNKLNSGELNETECAEIETALMMSKGRYYIKRKNSFRKYSALVSLPKRIRNKVFAGYYQLDLDACFASVAYHELEMKKCELEHANLLCGSKKQQLRQQIMNDFKCDYDKAKQISQYLFSGPYKHSWGVEWFDNLHKEISDKLRHILWNKDTNMVEFCGKNKKIDCFHSYFTYHEQMIIQAIKNNSLFQIHDAIMLEPEDELILSKNINANKIQYKGNDYYFKIEQI